MREVTYPQAYLPEGRIYYEPTENGFERRVKERMDYWRTLFERASESAAGISGEQGSPKPKLA